MKRGVVSLLTLAAALTLTACARTEQPDSMAGTDSTDDTNRPASAEPDPGYTAGEGEIVQIRGFRSIDIEWVSGAVAVELYDGEGIELTETAMDGSPVTQPMEWRVDEDDDTLDIRSQPQLVSLSEEKHLTVRLPRSIVLHQLDIDTVSADISVDLSEKDTITLSELDVTSISGAVKVNAANAEEISLSTTSGTVSGSVRTGKLETDSVSGSVELTLDILPTELDMESTGGSIALTLPTEPEAVDIDFGTVSGELRSEVKSTPGAASVWKLETISGDVDILLAK